MEKVKKDQGSLVQSVRKSVNRTYISALIVITLFSAILVNATAYKVAKDALLAETGLASNRVYWFFESYKYKAESVGQLSRLSSNEYTLDEKLEILNQRAEAYDAVRIGLIDLDGYGAVDHVYRGDREYFKQALLGVSYFENPMISRSDGQLVFCIGTPLWKDGVQGSEVVGVLHFNINKDIFHTVVEGLAISRNSDAFIISKDGTTVAAVDGNLVEEGFNAITQSQTDSSLRDLAELEVKMIRKEEGIDFLRYNGRLCIVGYAPIEGVEGWSLALTIPILDYAWIAITYLLIMIVVIGGIMKLITYMSRQISEQVADPLNSLTEKIKSFADKGIENAIDDADGPMEMKAISEAMNSIMARLDMAVNDNKKILEYANVSDLVDDQIMLYLHEHYEHYFGIDLIISDLNGNVIVGNIDSETVDTNDLRSDEGMSYITISDRNIGSVIAKTINKEELRLELNEAIAEFVAGLLSKISLTGFKYSVSDKRASKKRKKELERYSENNQMIYNSLVEWVERAENAGLVEDREILFDIINTGIGTSNMILGQLKAVDNEMSKEEGISSIEETEYTVRQLLDEIEHHVEKKLYSTSIRYSIKANENVPKVLFGDFKATSRLIYSLYLNQIDYSKSGTTGINVSSYDKGYAKMICFKIVGNRRYTKAEYMKIKQLLSEDVTLKGYIGAADKLELNVMAAARQAAGLNGVLDVEPARNGIVITFTLPQLEVNR